MERVVSVEKKNIPSSNLVFVFVLFLLCKGYAQNCLQNALRLRPMNFTLAI